MSRFPRRARRRDHPGLHLPSESPVMTIFARLFRLVWGGDVDRALRPVLAVSLVGSIAGASAYPFMAIWAIKELHAPQGTLAFSYLIGAGLAGLTGYAGGPLSDYIGRPARLLCGWGVPALRPPARLSRRG